MSESRIGKWLRGPDEAPEPASYDAAFVDEATQDHISGWALFGGGVEAIDVLVDGQKVGEAETGLLRADVEASLPEVRGSRDCGFCYLFQPGDLSRGTEAVATVQVISRSKTGLSLSSPAFEIPTARLSRRYDPLAPGSDRLTGLPSAPFPSGVHRALVELRGEQVYGIDSWTGDRMQEAVDDLIFLYSRASREARDLFWYFGYLREMWDRLEFNARNFPKINRSATEDRKDVYGVATSPDELFVISHQLANLKSRGIEGNLCEFGCFKGFSTSCLSNACLRLGVTMDVFDSFAGLPSSDSSLYREGEFKGSLEEVKRNVEEFGQLGAVRFHEGFFSESIPRYPEEHVACIWMDVDLDLSARDVMTLLPRLAPESCVFSDEIEPEFFSEGRVLPGEPNPDSVLPSICDAFGDAGRSIVGNFIAGHTGVFRDEKRGIPVIEAAPLLRLKDALLSR